MLGKAADLAYDLEHKDLYTLRSLLRPPSKESVGIQRRVDSRAAS